LRAVVVDEADRGRSPRFGIELQLADDHLAARAGADDEHLVLGQAVAVGRAARRSGRTASRAPAISISVRQKSITATERGSAVRERLQHGEEDDERSRWRRRRRGRSSRKSRPLT
jgi:hypothetical protein